MHSPIPDNESRRLAALRQYKLLDTPPEAVFDDFVMLASHICEVPIALISLLDEDRQWFKARVGLDVSQTPRNVSFCAHVIMSSETMVVEDALADERFATSPLVLSDPNIRFYAGVPLTVDGGCNLGTLCVIDRKPRRLSLSQQLALEALGRQLVAQFEMRRVSAELASALEMVKNLHGLLPICGYCKSIRNDQGYWRCIEEYIATSTDASLTHGICPDCVSEHYPELADEVPVKG